MEAALKGQKQTGLRGVAGAEGLQDETMGRREAAIGVERKSAVGNPIGINRWTGHIPRSSLSRLFVLRKVSWRASRNDARTHNFSPTHRQRSTTNICLVIILWRCFLQLDYPFTIHPSSFPRELETQDIYTQTQSVPVRGRSFLHLR